MSRFLKLIELPPRDDIYQDEGTTDWGNHVRASSPKLHFSVTNKNKDLYPIVPKERTYGKGAFMLYWLTCGGGLSTFAIGSSYIAVGLTAGEAVGAILIGACISSCNALLCGMNNDGVQTLYSRLNTFADFYQGRVGAETNLGYVRFLTPKYPTPLI
jgi:NCS1 family nucleobase:cation symporter-1